MINIEKVGTLGYYLQPEFADDQVNVRWGGRAKELLGLPDKFDTVMFERVLNGLNPYDGSKLTSRLKNNRRKGWDITTTDEKVSSVLELLAGDERITQLKRDANDFAMERIERKIATRVRKHGANEDRITSNVLWATFEHETNRDGMVHRHHHNVLCNITYDSKEKTWKAVELSQLLARPRDKRLNVLLPSEIKKIERAHTKFIVDGLKSFGYQVKSYGHRYEIKGVAEEIIQDHSPGKKRVDQKLKQFESAAHEKRKLIAIAKGMPETEAERLAAKPLADKQRAKLPLYDRPPKVGSGTREAMHKSWLERITPEEFKGLAGVAHKARHSVKRDRVRAVLRNRMDKLRQFVRQEVHRELGRGR